MDGGVEQCWCGNQARLRVPGIYCLCMRHILTEKLDIWTVTCHLSWWCPWCFQELGNELKYFIFYREWFCCTTAVFINDELVRIVLLVSNDAWHVACNTVGSVALVLPVSCQCYLWYHRQPWGRRMRREFHNQRKIALFLFSGHAAIWLVTNGSVLTLERRQSTPNDLLVV